MKKISKHYQIVMRQKTQMLRKRPMCWMAIGFLLIVSMFLVGRSYQEILNREDLGNVYLEGKIVDKQYKESSYGGYWQITLKKVKVSEAGKNRKTESVAVTSEQSVDTKVQKLEGKYLCQIQASDAETVEIKIGQQVLLNGTYSPWEEPSNPGQFDSGKYYGSLGILGQFKKCKIIKQGASYSKVREGMWQIRKSADEKLRQELGEEDGALISAMLLGEKSGLKEEDKNLYQRNGISHILAISGLHLMLLGMGIFKVLKMILGNPAGAVFSIIIMSIYCIFTGNSISTIRATIMFALSLTAGLLGKSYDSLSALGLAAILQLFINPYVLNNSGFLLSFLAVIGVTFVAPKLQELLEAKHKIAQSLCVSLASSITTLPVLLCNYGTYPWYSVILNLFILPPMSVLMFLAVVLTGIFLLPLESLADVGTNLSDGIFIIGERSLVAVKNLVVWCIKCILSYFEICCRVFEHAPFQDGYLGKPAMVQILIYVILIAVVIGGGIKSSKFISKMILLSAISILTMQIQSGAEITMLDVGQGDCVVIRNENGNVYLSDCGSSSVSQVGKYRLLPFLKYKGYGKIKGIFISHLDTDHKNGIVELLEMAPEERMEISYLFLPESVLWMKEDREIVLELQELARKNKTKIVYLESGDSVKDDSMEFWCLHPTGSEEKSSSKEPGRKEQSRKEMSRNNQSLVLLMSYKEFEILLTGDVEAAGEQEILKYLSRTGFSVNNSMRKESAGEKEGGVWKDRKAAHDGFIEVLKVAHHGSSGSGSEEFLEAIRPEVSLISCGKNNTYGHPHEETLERLENIESRIMTTVDSGAITLNIGKVVRVYEFRK